MDKDIQAYLLIYGWSVKTSTFRPDEQVYFVWEGPDVFAFYEKEYKTHGQRAVQRWSAAVAARSKGLQSPLLVPAPPRVTPLADIEAMGLPDVSDASE